MNASQPREKSSASPACIASSAAPQASNPDRRSSSSAVPALGSRASLEDVDRGQLLALEEFQKGASSRGNVGNPLRDAVFCDRTEGFASAGEGIGTRSGDS